MNRLQGLVCFLLLVALPGLAFAQSGVMLSESDFWAALRQTQNALEPAGTGLDSDQRAALLEIWRDVDAIELFDGRVIAVDMEWVRLPIESGDEKALSSLASYINRLMLTAPESEQGSDARLDTLETVLSDPRFQYGDVPTPTPIAMPIFDGIELDASPSGSAMGISQMVLFAIGVAVLGFVIFNIVRALQVRPLGADDQTRQTEEPNTASDATDAASSYADQGNYRSAIRYLYLSSLLWLHERGALRYDSTLTNREHLRQVRAQTQLHDVLRGIVNMFEDVWYGDLRADEAYYQRFVQQVEALRRVLP